MSAVIENGLLQDITERIQKHSLIGKVLSDDDIARYGDRVCGWRFQSSPVVLDHYHETESSLSAKIVAVADEIVQSAHRITEEIAKQYERDYLALHITVTWVAFPGQNGSRLGHFLAQFMMKR